MATSKHIWVKGSSVPVVWSALGLLLMACTSSRSPSLVASGRDGIERRWMPPLVASDEELDARIRRVGTDACAADPAACVALASVVVAMATENDDFQIASIATDSGCSRGDSASCSVSRVIRELPRGASLETWKWRVLEAACIAAPTPECAGVTRWYLANNLAVAADLEGLGATMQVLCEGGSAHACGAVGDVAWLRGETLESLRWYERACDGVAAHGCWMTGWLWATGAAGSQDRTRAGRAFRDACNAGYARGCLWSAATLAQGWGHEQELYAAAVFMDHACVQGAASGCGNVIDSLRAYMEGASSRLRSDQFPRDRMECVAEPEACFSGAVQALIASRDVDAFGRVAEVTCQRSVYAACTYTETVRRLGHGSPRPAPDGVFRGSCSAGDYAACLALEFSGEALSLEGARRACARG